METTAIALFGTRISPRFDCTQDFMFVTTSGSKVTEQHTKTIREHTTFKKVKKLVGLKVTTLICGGIDESSREYLSSHGIKVLANKKGLVADALSSCLTAANQPPSA